MSHSKTNNATRAEVDLSEIFASGTFKNVWAGTYTEGVRSGQRCVSKKFKTGSIFEAHSFEEELNIIRRTQEIIGDFDNAGVIGNGRKILLNTPAVWIYEDSGQKHLIEPKI